ncbi:MAG: enoyl-CoA hydratase/isomerase family protein [Burkholderiales bacterium]|nr:enoyl-CoA hydratase/isomerase family protein [Anaerolineae bacterium]
MSQNTPQKLLVDSQPNGIVVLTFNRPEAHNALEVETMLRFAEVVQALAADERLRAVILTGAGDSAFCSGGDLVELSNYPAADQGQRMVTLMGDALLTLERLPVPVIAAVNGYALGGGSEIALACDLRIVDENARLGLVHIRLGLIPGWGGGQRLLRMVGYSQALDLLLRGHIMRADELKALGVATRVVERGTSLSQALELAQQIASADAGTVRAIKSLLQAGVNHPYAEALDFERSLFPALWEADAHLRAVSDFMNKKDKES